MQKFTLPSLDEEEKNSGVMQESTSKATGSKVPANNSRQVILGSDRVTRASLRPTNERNIAKNKTTINEPFSAGIQSKLLASEAKKKTS